MRCVVFSAPNGLCTYQSLLCMLRSSRQLSLFAFRMGSMSLSISKGGWHFIFPGRDCGSKHILGYSNRIDTMPQQWSKA